MIRYRLEERLSDGPSERLWDITRDGSDASSDIPLPLDSQGNTYDPLSSGNSTGSKFRQVEGAGLKMVLPLDRSQARFSFSEYDEDQYQYMQELNGGTPASIAGQPAAVSPGSNDAEASADAQAAEVEAENEAMPKSQGVMRQAEVTSGDHRNEMAGFLGL